MSAMHRRTAILTAASALCVGISAYAQAAKQAPSADSVMSESLKKAKDTKKVALVHFGASWCIWCHRFEAVIEAPKVKPILGKYFVMVRLAVNESAANKALENPGAADWLNKLGGANAGIPFYAMLGSDGKKLGDSLIMAGKQNVGYPGVDEEITAFGDLLKKTAPKMTSADRSTVLAAFREAAKTLPAH